MSNPARIAPGPPGHFLLGHLREFRADVLDLVVRSAAEYGDIVRCRLGPHVVHLVNHPEHAEKILRSPNYDKQTRSSATIKAISGDSLLTCNGDFWRRQRRMDQPAFHHRQIAGFTDKMTAAAGEMLERWSHHPSGEPLDIAPEMARVTYSIVGRTLFSFDTGADSEAVEEAMRVMLPHVFEKLGRVVNLPGWFPSPANRRFTKALGDVDRVVYRIIAEHRAAMEAGEMPTDLLAMLMAARDPDTGEALPDSQLRNETITFLLAGHETTANALTWIFHLIATHPDVEAALVEEIDTVLGGRTPVFQDIPALRYTKRAIQEAMRLYPPIWIIERRVIREDVIGGYHFPAGSSVVISPFALHRHPGFWEEPEKFDPDRFLQPPPDAYIPFGLGPRFCIGNEFAMLEAHIIVAMVLQRYRLRMLPGHVVVRQPDITLRARHGMMMTLNPAGG